VVRNKKPAGVIAGGFVFLISLADLVQAIAVRRHGGPVVMMVTGMAVEFHLLQSYGIRRRAVK
jgi:hypothetical protein